MTLERTVSQPLQERDALPYDTVKFDRNNTANLLQKANEDLPDVQLRKFKVTHVLSKGKYTEIFLASLKATQKLYAIKVMRKDVMLKKRDINCFGIESEIMF